MRPRPRVRRGLALAWQALGRALPRAGVWGYEAAPPVMGYPSVAPRAPQLLAPLPTSGPGDLAATPADSSPGALNAAPLGSADVRVLNLPKGSRTLCDGMSSQQTLRMAQPCPLC